MYDIPIEVEEDGDGRVVIFCECDKLFKACPECGEEIEDYVDRAFCELKVLARLMLRKYGLKEIDEGWEDNIRYLILTLRNADPA
jgi:hypothetical protein